MTISHFNRVRCICAWRGGGKAKNDRGREVNLPTRKMELELERSGQIGWITCLAAWMYAFHGLATHFFSGPQEATWRRFCICSVRMYKNPLCYPKKR